MDDEVSQAYKNLAHNEILFAQFGVLTVAVRALISSHPDRPEFEKVYHQMIGQVQSGSSLSQSKDFALVFRHFASSLLETESE